MAAGLSGRFGATTATVALIGAVSLAGPAPAHAHAVLTATDPHADTTLQAGPTQVRAKFSEQLQPEFAAMTVVGPDGRLWSSGDPAVDGSTLSVAVPPLGTAGRYTVSYRVTSADGHPVSGSWSFTVASAGDGKPRPPVDAATGRSPIPLWAFAAGGLVLVIPAVIWGLRRRP